jgi:hypothetical protein
MFLVIDLAKVIVNIGWFSLVVLVLIVLYRLLLKRMKRGEIKLDEYVELYPLDSEFATGTVQFFFKNKAPKEVQFIIYSANESFSEVLTDQTYKPGGHILKFDTTKVPNGKYYFELKTENQKTSKLMEVRN